ncbi:hypothetical protein DFA_12337 [Cavenderia fasciculata]|uniref:HIT-type domain-containing protein n=1 Tax=Cavenderia fasciculata TaxID=261658 RepID=F4QD90_CACFS|nr:uncharacterized protein DFA_12337 [Cavenderia fasciculata]EGG14561.1 hypothetical protein DFA_12337 [Cavenderia fasciculata]|eukprot:XP_004366081.1 hypothetical protein DFA_12337 [Cavenderia fasciculata]
MKQQQQRQRHHLDFTDDGISSVLKIIDNNKQTISNTSTERTITKNKAIKIQVIDQQGDEEKEEKDVNINVNSNGSNDLRTKSGLCTICNHQFTVYSCPRCFIGYCSSQCFKQHNEKCTDSFYETQVREGLESIDKSTPSEALNLLKKMKKIYDREDNIYDSLIDDNDQEDEDDHDVVEQNDGNEQDDREEEEPIDLSKLNLDDMSEEQLLALLTKEEIEEFHRSIQDGSISNTIEEWVPWWIQKEQQQQTTKIIEIQEKDDDIVDDEDDDDIPDIYENIVPLSKIFPGNPSSTLINNLLDIVRFNGDWGSKTKTTKGETEYDIGELVDGCNTILEISTTLNKSTCQRIFNSASESLQNILSMTNKFDGNNYNTTFILEDVSSIFTDKKYILALLSHCHKLFNQSFDLLNQTINNNNRPTTTTNETTTTTTTTTTTNDQKMTLQLIRFATNKLSFYLSWAAEHLTHDAAKISLDRRLYNTNDGDGVTIGFKLLLSLQSMDWSEWNVMKQMCD